MHKHSGAPTSTTTDIRLFACKKPGSREEKLERRGSRGESAACAQVWQSSLVSLTFAFTDTGDGVLGGGRNGPAPHAVPAL